MDYVQSVGALNLRSALSLFAIALFPLAISIVATKIVAGPKAIWPSAVVVALLLPVALVLGLQLIMAKVRVSCGALTAGGTFYTQTVERRDIDVENIISLADSQIPPIRHRSNGVGMPGASIGWFVRADGRRSFLAVSDWSQSVLIPTRKDFDIIVSVTNPSDLRAALAQPQTVCEPYSAAD